jgi:hypothetical protein
VALSAIAETFDRRPTYAPVVPAMPNRWILRIAVLLLVLGTAKYVERDAFHQDDSILQPAIEVTCVMLGTCLALGAAFHYRARLTFGWPYVLLLLTLTLALIFSARSWDPALSAPRTALLLMISTSIAALLRTYGLRRLAYCIINSYVLLIAVALAVGLVAPEEFPLLLHDPGEEAVRLRLHLLKIYPIVLADDCAICLMLSVFFQGKWMRLCRLILAACLLMTVTRASIIFGFPLYLACEFLSTARPRFTLRPSSVAGAFVFLPALVGAGLLLALSDWGPVEEIQTSIMHVVDATKDDSTLNGRTSLWTILVEDLSWDNFYGYGVGGARYYVRSVNLWAQHSHNSVLETVYISGYVGAFLLVAGLVAALAFRIREWKFPEARVLAVTLVYVIATGMMNPSWYEAAPLIAISIVCVGAWEPIRRRNAVSAVPLNAAVGLA